MRVPVARIQRQTGPSAFRCTAPGNGLGALKIPCNAWLYFPRPAEQPLAPLADGFVPGDLRECVLSSMEQNEHNTTLGIEFPHEIPAGAWVYVEGSDFARNKEDIYFFQIRGLKVLDEQGTERGKVLDYMETGASGVLVLAVGEREVMMPVVEPFIEFHIDQGYILARSFEDFL